jgi:hypothetical protein
VKAALEREPAWRLLLASCVNPELKKYMGLRHGRRGEGDGETAEEALLALVEAEQGAGLGGSLLDERGRRPARHAAALGELRHRQPGPGTDGPFARTWPIRCAFGSMARGVGRYVRDERV